MKINYKLYNYPPVTSLIPKRYKVIKVGTKTEEIGVFDDNELDIWQDLEEDDETDLFEEEDWLDIVKSCIQISENTIRVEYNNGAAVIIEI